PRTLHSFPTRRSSDLASTARASASLPTRSWLTRSNTRQSRFRCRRSERGSDRDGLCHGRPLGGRLGGGLLQAVQKVRRALRMGRDRKSTRLNSSHVKI